MWSLYGESATDKASEHVMKREKGTQPSGLDCLFYIPSVPYPLSICRSKVVAIDSLTPQPQAYRLVFTSLLLLDLLVEIVAKFHVPLLKPQQYDSHIHSGKRGVFSCIFGKSALTVMLLFSMILSHSTADTAQLCRLLIVI